MRGKKQPHNTAKGPAKRSLSLNSTDRAKPYAVKLLDLEVVGLQGLAILGELKNLLALRKVARHLEQVFSLVFHAQSRALGVFSSAPKPWQSEWSATLPSTAG